MSDLKDWIIKNNKTTAPVISLLVSILLIYIDVYLVGIAIFLVPVAIFFTFHYTKLYKLKLRFYGGSIVVIIVALLFTAVSLNAIYNSDYTYQNQFTDGSLVDAKVTPFSGSSSQYTYSIFIVPNGTLNYSTLQLNIYGEHGYSKVVNYSSMSVVQSFSGNNTERLSYVLTGIASDSVYSYNLSFIKNGTVVTTKYQFAGPLNTSVLNIFIQEWLNIVYWFFVLEIIYVAGLFIGRSMGKSREYRQSRLRPPEEGPKL